MSSPAEQLPPGWVAEWDATHQRYLFIETASGHTQWEPPAQVAPAVPDHVPGGSPPPAHHAGKRRQYAAGQTQAYYGNEGLAPEPYGQGGSMQQPGGQLFTPGLVAEQQFQAQQSQPPVGPGQAPYYGQQTEQPDYINGPGYAQQPSYGQAPVDALAGQFGQMGMGQKQFQLYTTNLLTSPPEPRELYRPPPEIRLPPNSCISPSPFANADPSYQRSTLNAVPTTASLLSKAKIPLALVITPYRSLNEGEDPVPLVTDTVIARCRRCRTYINPYVQFIDGGNRWRCCMCNMSNEVPQLFDWDQARNQPGDRWARAELNHSVVEFVAPTEYMVRPPQPAVYVFLIDVSHAAVQSGMVATATRTILENLDRIPDEDGRTKVAIVCFDVSLYFFSLPPGTTESTMLVVSDIDDVFLPKPTDLLVNLAESRGALESLLGRINDMFQENSIIGSAMGPALQTGFKLMAPIGGKIIVLSATLPSLGPGALKNREDPKILGTSKESGLLQAASPFYKTFAIECSRAQVSVDMFLFSAAYQDVASLACLPHYTSGQTYYYPAFNAGRSEDALKFAHEFGRVLAVPIMLEAVMRVRASRGLRMASFHGNFFVRSTDLLAMPAVPQDQSYAIEIQIEDTIPTPFVVLQTAVLHTTCYGERRIRVITLALPTTTNLSEVFASADQVAIGTLLANKAVERSLTHKLEDARDYIFQKLVDILVSYKTSMTSGGAGASAGLVISENLKMLPVLVLGLLKNVGVRQSAQIPPDIRAYSQALLTSLPSQLLIPYIYPTFYSLHNMPPEAGTVGENGVIMPQALPLTSERMERHGLFLIEDGQTIFLWVGRDAVPQLVMDVFNLPNYEVLRGGKTTLPLLDNPFSQRVNAIIQKTRESRRGVYYPHLYVVKDDGEPPLRLWALSALIQDRADVLPSYQQFLSSLKDKDDESSRTPKYLGYFDVSNTGFAWREPVPQQIERRRALLNDTLIFDTLLSSGGIREPDILFPPSDVESLVRLLNAIEASHYDTLKKECLIYLLLKWHQDGREAKFQTERCIPPQFGFLADAYWHLDTGINVPRAVAILSDVRLNRDYPSKILHAISLSPNPAPLIVRYVRTAKPLLTEPSDLDVYTLALADSSLFEAWQYQRTFNETDPTRSRLLTKLIEWCITPKPQPRPLTVLLGLPLSQFEESLIHAYALDPPSSLDPSSVAVLRELICVRLIQSGNYAEAIKIDHQFTSSTLSEPKNTSQERKKLIQDIYSALPRVERTLLDAELDTLTQGRKPSSSIPTKKGPIPNVNDDDLSMSQTWEEIPHPPTIQKQHVTTNGQLANVASPFRNIITPTVSVRSTALRFGGSIATPTAAPVIPISSPATNNISAPRKSFPLPSIPSSNLNISVSRPRQSLTQTPNQSLLGASTSTSALKNSVSGFPPVASGSSTNGFNSAAKKQNAFFQPPPAKVNGVKRTLDGDGDSTMKGNSHTGSPSKDADVNMDMDDSHVEVASPIHEPEREEEQEEVHAELGFSVFGNDPQVHTQRDSDIESPETRTRSSRAKAPTKPVKKVPPGAFHHSEEEDGEADDDHEEVTWKAPQRSRVTRAVKPTVTKPAIRTRRVKDQDLGRSLPGSLMDEDEDEEDDYVAPLRAPSPPRRPLRKGRSSTVSDLGQDETGVQTRRRSSRLSTAGSIRGGSPELPSPKKISSGKTKKKTTSGTRRK